MRWTRGDRSNVDDVRGGGGGGGVGIPLGIGGVLVLLVGSWLTGVNLFDIVGGGAATDVVADRPAVSSPEEEKMVDFVDAVMGDIQSTWSAKLGSYQPTRAVLFRDSIQSACGLSSSATGPFYCPADRKVYLDLAFSGRSIRSSARPAISPRPTSSRTKPGITFRT
jgi:predicted metalloprotease